jgi:hypothetical protein
MGTEKDDLDEHWCAACETNPAKLERDAEQAEARVRELEADLEVLKGLHATLLESRVQCTPAERKVLEAVARARIVPSGGPQGRPFMQEPDEHDVCEAELARRSGRTG